MHWPSYEVEQNILLAVLLVIAAVTLVYSAVHWRER